MEDQDAEDVPEQNQLKAVGVESKCWEEGQSLHVIRSEDRR